MAESARRVMSYEDLVDLHHATSPFQVPPARVTGDDLRALGHFVAELTPFPALYRQGKKTVKGLAGERQPPTWEDFWDLATIGSWFIPPAVVYRLSVPAVAGVTSARRGMEKLFTPEAAQARRFAEENPAALGSAPNFGLANVISRAERAFDDPVRVPWEGLWAPGMEQLLARYGTLRLIEGPTPSPGAAVVRRDFKVDPVFRRELGKSRPEMTYHGTQNQRVAGLPVLPSLASTVYLNKRMAMDPNQALTSARFWFQGPLHVTGHEVGHLMDLTSGLTRGAASGAGLHKYRSNVVMPQRSRPYNEVLDYMIVNNPRLYDPLYQTTKPSLYHYVRLPEELAAEALREALIRPYQLPPSVRNVIDDLLIDSANVNRVMMPWW